ncbi:MAG: hypothetical protein R6U26_02805 [Candidatus Undinarchaeales archaeon]
MNSKDKEKIEKKKAKAKYKTEKKKAKAEAKKTKAEAEKIKSKKETNIFFSNKSEKPWYKDPGWLRAIAAIISVIVAVIGILLAQIY